MCPHRPCSFDTLLDWPSAFVVGAVLATSDPSVPTLLAGVIFTMPFIEVTFSISSTVGPIAAEWWAHWWSLNVVAGQSEIESGLYVSYVFD
jgi:hypothetical protein